MQPTQRNFIRETSVSPRETELRFSRNLKWPCQIDFVPGDLPRSNEMTEDNRLQIKRGTKDRSIMKKSSRRLAS